MKPLRFSLVLIVLCMGAAAGCYFSQGYPSPWPRPAVRPESEMCDVSGTFSAVGVGVKKEPFRFIELVDRSYRDHAQAQPAPGDTLHIEYLTGALTISVSEGDVSLWSRQFGAMNGVYLCTKKGVRVRIGGWDDSGPAGAGGEDYYLFLRVAADGSLLVKHKKVASGMGFMLIPFIPYAYGYSKWYKFERKPGASSPGRLSF